jgi:sodium-dependent dicarboxylate transporter 2/3/5
MTTSPTDARDLRPSEAPGSPAAAEATEQRDALDSGAKRNWWLLALGPVAGLVLALVLPASLSFEGRAVAGCALWMAIWWMTEAAPIPVTSLLPLVLFPLFGMASMKGWRRRTRTPWCSSSWAG